MSTKQLTHAGRDADAEAFIASIDPATMRDAGHLRAIAEARKNLADAERALYQAVVDAREAGDSWTMIGLMLGTSKQAAQRKFGRKPTL